MRMRRTELSSFICSDRKTGNKKPISRYKGCYLNLWVSECYLGFSVSFVHLFLCLFRAFEDLQVFWRVTFNKAFLSLVNDGVNLTKELVQTSGSTLCKSGEMICSLTLKVQDDDVRTML